MHKGKKSLITNETQMKTNSILGWTFLSMHRLSSFETLKFKCLMLHKTLHYMQVRLSYKKKTSWQFSPISLKAGKHTDLFVHHHHPCLCPHGLLCRPFRPYLRGLLCPGLPRARPGLRLSLTRGARPGARCPDTAGQRPQR